MEIRLTPPQCDAIWVRMQQTRISQQKLGLLLGGVPQATVSGKLSGRRAVTAEELAILGAVLGLPELQDASGLAPAVLSDTVWEVIARVIITHLRSLDPHDRGEVLFGIAMAFESKRPFGESPYTRLLRQLSGLVHGPVKQRAGRLPRSAVAPVSTASTTSSAVALAEPQLVF
jgi:hypothetical protein